MFRAALEPLELSGKLRGVLLQYHPRFTKSAEAKAELARAPERLAPLVPLVEFRHRSWMEEDERADTLAFLEANGLAFVSLDSPRTRASNVSPHDRRRDAPRSRTSASTAATRRPGTSAAPRPRPSASTGSTRRRSWRSGSSRWRGSRSESDEVYAMFNNNRDDFAPRSAQILRGLLDEAGVPADGRDRAAADRADAVLSSRADGVGGPGVGGGASAHGRRPALPAGRPAAPDR